MATPSERFRKSITNDNLWIYILTLLKKEKLYGYEINEKIKKKFGFSPGNITAYIVLKRLQIDGYIKVIEKKKSGGPERRYFEITKKGRKELEKAKKFYREIGKIMK